MAYNFSANQFEGSFKPKKLGNWEVAKWFPERPRAHRTPTKIIADDRGHLLPGVHRAPSSPWGEFRGTWELPKKISRKTAEELNKPFTRARQSWIKRSSHIPIISPEPSPESPEDKENRKSPLVANDSSSINYCNKEDDKDSGVDVSNDPSSPVRELEEKSRRSCYEKYTDDDYSKTTAYDKTPANINTSGKVQKDVDEFIRNCKSPKESQERENGLEEMPQENVEVSRKKKGPALASSYCGTQIAKNLAVENLKHHPLPDTVEDAIYRSLQMKKEKHPGKALDVLPRAAAIGCKSYGTPGPTQCSKLKVYRPKTAGVLPRKESGQSLELLTRPKTSSGFDQHARKDKKMSQMQLALCWDLKPPNPGDEPKRSPHIDGSNGSAAPAVFALVQPPQEEPPPESPAQTRAPSSSGEGGRSKKHHSKPRDAWGATSPDNERDIHRGRYGVTNPSAVMDIINTNTTQSANVVGPKENIHQHRNSRGSGNRRTECNSAEKNAINNTCRNGGEIRKDSHNSSISSGFDSEKLSRRKHCHSSPNLTNVGVEVDHNDVNNNDNGCGRNGRNKLLNNRPCMACDKTCSASPPSSGNCHKSAKPEYKMAFKAGKPDNNGYRQNGSTKNNGSNASGHTLSSLRSSGYQAPKPKAPYAKRSYSIGTLAPPFSLWPGTTGQDYPEHWRLASVYQHSYKPMGSRRKTFLQSVYQ